jgi:microcin C transport system permease protein
MLKLNPLTVRKLNRFRAIKRGYYSLLIIVGMLLVSGVLELLVNNRALVVRHDGEWHFPTYSKVRVGSDFGLTGTDANIPVNYRELKATFAEEDNGDFVIMPLIPYGPNENNAWNGFLRPRPPTWEAHHLLGTDTTGRDILARLLYGFRTAMIFSLSFTFIVFAFGIVIGCVMGYFGGWIDLLGQRMIEIWSNVPFLYVVIIIYSVVPSTISIEARIGILMAIMVGFSWMGLTYYMRTGAYKEKARDYVAAAKVLGASSGRIVWKHILPNSIATIVTFIPFTVVGGITAVTALDFVGFGLPPPTPSMGELLKQGVSNLHAWWIITSAVVALVLILTLVTFVGEAIREAFDPKKFTIYQ